MLGGRAAAESVQDFQLTGLINLGASRIACVKTISGESLTLHPGETASGLTLKDLDVKNGWALLEQGTNLIRLRLASYCASGTASFAPSPRMRQSDVRDLPAVLPAIEQAARDIFLAKAAASPESARAEGLALPGMPLFPPANHSTAETVPPVAASGSPAAPTGTASLSPVSDPTSASSSPSTQPESTVQPQPNRLADGRDARWYEGEMVRALYGEGALSAWGRDQYVKSLGLKAQ